ncbi:hypothetical protein GGR56DRAFT_683861 [Xylariaceae sp. FL0804]|nr:hypothetical protein GGR56DRAFT_683861 [Xylariaceae sp. FL0804]
MDSTTSSPILGTQPDTIYITTFYVLNWIFFALCILAFGIRAYIRWVCFRRLFLEDYLMVVSLVLHCAEAVIVQIYVQYAFDVVDVEHGELALFGPNLSKGLAAYGACVNITIVGVLLIKLNFLLFFRRLGAQLFKFNMFWWGVTVFTVASSVVQIGMETFGCFFGGVEYIFFSGHCTDSAATSRIFFNAIFSATVDAFSDLLILVLPISLLWGSHINMRKKLILLLQPFQTSKVQEQNTTFTWFWFYCEFTVAFIVACVVSFRSLFVQRDTPSSTADREREQREAAYRSALRHKRSWVAKVRHMHDSVLDTCKTLEGWDGSKADTLSMRNLTNVPSGLMTVDFEDDANWSRAGTREGPKSSTEPIVPHSLP